MKTRAAALQLRRHVQLRTALRALLRGQVDIAVANVQRHPHRRIARGEALRQGLQAAGTNIAPSQNCLSGASTLFIASLRQLCSLALDMPARSALRMRSMAPAQLPSCAGQH